MLIKQFTNVNRRYVYDAVTNSVMEICSVVSDALSLGPQLNRAEITEQLRSKHGVTEVERALEEVASASQEGLFQPMKSEIAKSGRSFLCADDYESRLRHLVLTLTESCNNRCSYCIHESDKPWVRTHSSVSMSKQSALNALRYFAERCHETAHPVVSFYGGEPLLEFELIRSLVLEAKSHTDWPSLQFTISTNGTLLNDEIIDFVLEHEIRLQVSLDGPEPIHDRHRTLADGRPTHQQLEQTITTIIARDTSFHSKMSYIATLAPPFDLKAISEHFKNFPPYKAAGIDAHPKVVLNVVDLEGITLPDLFDMRDCSRAIYDARKEYVTSCTSDSREQIGPILTSQFEPDLIKFYHRSTSQLSPVYHATGTCAPGIRKLHVAVDGTYQPCERVGQSIPIGHVNSGVDLNLMEEAVSTLYRAVSEQCQGCWALRLCNLCLTAIAPLGTMTTDEAQEHIENCCVQSRAKAESTLKLYTSVLAADQGGLDFLSHSVLE